MNPRVLVTGVGGPAGSAIAAQLMARGIHVVGTDIRELPVGAGFPLFTVPPASDPDLVAFLRRLVIQEGINLVIPTVSEELPQIAAFKPAFGADVQVIVGHPGPVALANDKLFTAWHLHAAGIPVPRFGVPADFADAGAAMDALGGPVVVKPRVSRGGRGVMVIDGTTEVDWQHLPEGQIVQEFIPGDEYGPMVFGTTPGNDVASFVVVVEKTELAQGIVGNAVATRRVNAGEATDVGSLALDAVRSLGLSGPVDMDVRRRADGTPVVLEVNARFGANCVRAPELLDAVLAAFVPPAFNAPSFRLSAATDADVLV